MDLFLSIWEKSLFTLSDGHAIRVSQVALALIFLIAGFLLVSVFTKILSRKLLQRQVPEAAVHLAEKVIFYLLVIAVVFSSLRILEIPLTVFAFLGGALAIGAGFGTQNILNNLISGWILTIERPVRVGDLVEIDGVIGRVAAMKGRCTRIRRTDGIDLLVPNSLLLERVLTNWTLTDKEIRTTVRVGVRYGSPTDQVAALIARAAQENEEILKRPEPIVIFEDFADSALIFDIYFWCVAETDMKLRQVRSALRFHIDELFREADIVIAYPQQDIHLDTENTLDVRIVGDSPPA